MTRHSQRMTISMLAVALLLFGVAGAGAVGGHASDHERRSATGGSAEQAEGVLAEVAMLDRRVAAQERVDRGHRTAVRDAAELAEAQAEAAKQRVGLAEEAATRQAEEPPATPDSDEDSGGDSGDDAAPAPDVPSSCGEYSDNRATGCALLLEWGFALDQMSCLDSLWSHESGWNHRAENPSSGAYGIPQALPGSKMAEYGDDWRTNPATQIRWGLNYIENRYGTPCGAWSFFQSNNWY